MIPMISLMDHLYFFYPWITLTLCVWIIAAFPSFILVFLYSCPTNLECVLCFQCLLGKRVCFCIEGWYICIFKKELSVIWVYRGLCVSICTKGCFFQSLYLPWVSRHAVQACVYYVHTSLSAIPCFTLSDFNTWELSNTNTLTSGEALLLSCQDWGLDFNWDKSQNVDQHAFKATVCNI